MLTSTYSVPVSVTSHPPINTLLGTSLYLGVGSSTPPRMKSHIFSLSSQPRLAPSPPRPLQLLAECSLRNLLPRTRDICQISSAERDRYPYRRLSLGQSMCNYRIYKDRDCGKRKILQTMDAHHQPDDFQGQVLQQHQQKEGKGLTPLTQFIYPINIARNEEDGGLTTLICAARSSVPETPTTITDPRRPIVPVTVGISQQKALSVCSASSSCCDDDNCSSECEDEECNAPCGECTACEIVPKFCDSESCLEQGAPCPEDSCIQEIICAKDGCEVTSCHAPDYSLRNGGFQSFDTTPGWSLPLGGYIPQHQHQHLHQHQHGSVEPDLLSLNFNNPNQRQDLHLLHDPLSTQQLMNYPMPQINLAPEPSESSRSSSAFLETYNGFSAPFDTDYTAPSKRRRVSQTIPMTSPAYEYSSKPATTYSIVGPLQNWPNYNSTGNNNWNNTDLLFTTDSSNHNLLDLGECHWDGCNFHFDSDEDLQMHFSTHLGELTPNQCLWDACGISVNGIEDLKEHLALHLLPAGVDSSAVSSPEAMPDDGGAKRCEWLIGSGGEAVKCGKPFTSAEELQKHAKDEHIATLEKKTGYFCGWADCGRRDRAFSQKGKVERHLQTHTGFKSCKCTFCNKEFSAAQALQQHIRTHTGEKPYKCDICFKEFAQGSALTMHKRVHTGDRPLKCEFPGCGKKFSESSNLSKHRKTHLSVGQHQCGFAGCDRTFHRPDQMKRHQKVHGTASSPSASIDNLFLEQAGDFALHPLHRKTDKKAN